VIGRSGDLVSRCVCELTGIIGALLVIVSSLPPPRPKFLPTGAIPIMGARRRKWQRRTRARFSSLPPFGLMWSLLFPGLIFVIAWANRVDTHPIGFTVHSIKDISQVQPFPGFPSLIVRVGLDLRHARHPHYFINAEEISLSRLRDLLKDKLRYRPDKVAFIQADPDVEYQWVISAVDTAKSTGSAVVLVTSAERRPTP